MLPKPTRQRGARNSCRELLWERKATRYESMWPVKGTHSEKHRDEDIEIGDKASVTGVGMLNARCFGLPVDALTGSVPGENGGREENWTIYHHTQASTGFSVGIFVAPRSMIVRKPGARFSGGRREDERTARSLSARTVGVLMGNAMDRRSML
jgi:hypothetical protein